MRGMFLISGSKNCCDAIFLDMISKIKTARHAIELQSGLSNLKVSWEKKETKEN